MQKPKTLQELYNNPEKWTRGAYARSKSGRTVKILSPRATCWCLSGAIDYVYGNGVIYISVWRRLTNILKDGIINFNDDPKTTFKDVIKVVKKAGV